MFMLPLGPIFAFNHYNFSSPSMTCYVLWKDATNTGPVKLISKGIYLTEKATVSQQQIKLCKLFLANENLPAIHLIPILWN